MKPFMKYGGLVASVMLIALGIGAIVIGLTGRSEVRNTLKQEQIVGTPDMDKQIANKPVDTGAKAKLFAEGMRGHALEATGGQVYSQMGRYLTAANKPTNDEKAAAIDKATGKPVENGARNLWVTETALANALNTSFFAERVATFAIVMGFALFLIGIGFLVIGARADDRGAGGEHGHTRPRVGARDTGGASARGLRDRRQRRRVESALAGGVLRMSSSPGASTTSLSAPPASMGTRTAPPPSRR